MTFLFCMFVVILFTFCIEFVQINMYNWLRRFVVYLNKKIIITRNTQTAQTSAEHQHNRIAE